ncbi:ribosome assembly factor SBDS [archaeon]|jgi:ribosome maturation protein SDO1|nr:ribosome assembly factor SBDS [archaeon]MBT4242252.1 ribosome assembly factor SBDS [archaeon]MBT4417940.1 ribosome assembly factor SBDS [archaeon]
MTDVTARLRHDKLIFETKVDLDSAMKLKKGESVDMGEVIRDNAIYSDLKKGMRAGNDELMSAFGTTELNEVVERIVKKGDIEVTQEFRDEAIESKRKQIIEFLTKNAVDTRTGRPYTPDILESSIKEAGVRIDKSPVDKQIKNVIEGLIKIIPIKIETKKLKVTIPAQHTGQVYGLIQEYKEKEEWLPNGDLEVILNIPVGIQSDFYDKLNSVTHGSAITSEIKEEQ